jgi:hypothetical protein
MGSFIICLAHPENWGFVTSLHAISILGCGYPYCGRLTISLPYE